jgi:cytochrome c-type biogenesis protein
MKKFLIFLLFIVSLSLAQDEEKIAFQNFSLADFSGVKYDFEKILKSSKVTILSFWASWCEPCLKELVELKDVYEKYYNDGLRIVTVNIDSRYDLIKAKRFALQNKLKYIMLYDDGGEVRKKYNVESLPQMFIFDKDGNLKGHFRGFKDIKIIENKINGLLYGGEEK